MKKQTGAMNRRELLLRSAAFGAMAVIPASALAKFSPGSRWVETWQEKENKTTETSNKLSPPLEGNIPIAFLISSGVDPIDVFGPWEVFHQANSFVSVPFRPYSVGETAEPIGVMGGGIKLIPDYTPATAVPPKVVVIPAQPGGSEAMLDWIRKSTKSADVTMSVCTGATLLARTGLLSGKAATTHHGAYRELAVAFPEIKVQRGVRFVEEGKLATSGGLFSGIDLALRVVERYFGREAAKKTAYECEYQGEGWLNPGSNEIYAQVRDSSEDHPLCPVCEMAVDPATALKSVYKGKTYYFESEIHKKEFDAAPEKFIQAMQQKR
jgi:YHS domain-containing protein/putative intracellular protease/amidase